MREDARLLDEALMKRLSEAICDVSGSPTASENQLDGVVRMLREAPSRFDAPGASAELGRAGDAYSQRL
jgi:hypothetical protein